MKQLPLYPLGLLIRMVVLVRAVQYNYSAMESNKTLIVVCYMFNLSFYLALVAVQRLYSLYPVSYKMQEALLTPFTQVAGCIYLAVFLPAISDELGNGLLLLNPALS